MRYFCKHVTFKCSYLKWTREDCCKYLNLMLEATCEMWMGYFVVDRITSFFSKSNKWYSLEILEFSIVFEALHWSECPNSVCLTNFIKVIFHSISAGWDTNLIKVTLHSHNARWNITILYQFPQKWNFMVILNFLS